MQAALASHKGSGRALHPTHISLERLSAQSWSQKSQVSIHHCSRAGLDGWMDGWARGAGSLFYLIFYSSRLLTDSFPIRIQNPLQPLSLLIPLTCLKGGQLMTCTVLWAPYCFRTLP